MHPLRAGDWVEIVAPASRGLRELAALKSLLSTWGLQVLVDERIFGEDLLCANSDSLRFNLLKQAFERRETKAIICVRGGYGSLRLLPALRTMPPPLLRKWFIGMSDITALHLFLQQSWQWPTLHGSLITGIHAEASIAATKAVLFGEKTTLSFDAMPLNDCARVRPIPHAVVTGGNLCIVQTSLGTAWQIDARHKILFLEDTGERGYQVDRILTHLQQAGVFQQACAVVFGDFTKALEPDGTSLIEGVLARFAQSCEIPVFQVNGIGHGYHNAPLPLGSRSRVYPGDTVRWEVIID